MNPAVWNIDDGGLQLWLACLLALAALLALVRLCLRQWRGMAGNRLPMWRLLALLALQPLAAVLLWLTLSPPGTAVPGATLTVLTEGVDAAALADTGDTLLIALPEAGVATAHAERVPDLGTALRRHPQARTVRVLGHGLVPRDRDALDGQALEFLPAALPAGLVALQLPEVAVAGGTLRVGGRVHGLEGGRAVLLDPAGQAQDAQPLAADGRFLLTAGLRLPGEAVFALRLEDADGAVRGTTSLPVWVEAGLPLRVSLRAGAPSPEVKHLRRWAQDAGLRMQAQIATGAGLQSGDAVTPLDAAHLAEVDLLIADERSWAGWNAGQRQAVLEAVEQGMGLLLRVSAPPSAAVRTQWHALGFAVEGAGAPISITLPAPARETATDSTDTSETQTALPTLGRIGLRIDAGDAAVLARDADGNALGWWQPRGLGRIGLWLPADSFRLVLGGHADVHAALWAGVVEELARAAVDAPRPVLAGNDVRAGQRLQLCAVADGTQVLDAAGTAMALHVDPRSGAQRCAGYWPTAAGWHQVGTADQPGHRFFVRDVDDAPLLALAARQQDTQALVGPGNAPADAATAVTMPGSPWPWALGWLLAMAASWWLERRRRSAPVQP